LDKELQQILEDFSTKLQNYEEKGKDLPDDVDKAWLLITDVLMDEE
jgi:hypothetical protein